MTHDFPIIKIEIEGIKQNICHAISDNNKEINQAVENEISRAIDAIDIKSLVKSGVQDCIQSAIKDYFNFGSGRRTIKDVVFNALNEHLVLDTTTKDSDN